MTTVTIIVYGVPNDPNNEKVCDRVKSIPGVRVKVVECPPSVRDLYRMPIVQDEAGGRHFGLEGVERFVTERLQVERIA